MVEIRGVRRSYQAIAVVVVLSLGLAACGSSASSDERPTVRSDTPAAVDARPRIVALGDSLTAGLGLPLDQAFPSVLQRRIDDAGYAFEVVNAGVSGDTTAGGRRRLAWALDDGAVRVLIIALGANDGLRGLSIEQMRANLSAMIEEAQARDVRVLLAGMEALPNFGPEYTTAFRGVYPELARQYDTDFLPFLLDGVAGVPSLNQADGVHPNAEGAQRVADLVWGALEPILSAVASE